MRIRCVFTLDGILGAETFDTKASGLDAYQEAQEAFWDYARECRAVRLDYSGCTAWQQIGTYYGPKLLWYSVDRS